MTFQSIPINTIKLIPINNQKTVVSSSFLMPNLIIIFALIVLCFKNSYPQDNDYGKYVAPAKTKPKDIIRSDS